MGEPGETEEPREPGELLELEKTIKSE